MVAAETDQEAGHRLEQPQARRLWVKGGRGLERAGVLLDLGHDLGQLGGSPAERLGHRRGGGGVEQAADHLHPGQ